VATNKHQAVKKPFQPDVDPGALFGTINNVNNLLTKEES